MSTPDGFSDDERIVLCKALGQESSAARRDCLALYLASNGGGATIDLFARFVEAVRHSDDLRTILRSAVIASPATVPPTDMFEPVDGDSVERLAGILEAWGQNSADPDFFAGDVLDMVLGDCERAARLIRYLAAERNSRS